MAPSWRRRVFILLADVPEGDVIRPAAAHAAGKEMGVGAREGRLDRGGPEAEKTDFVRIGSARLRSAAHLHRQRDGLREQHRDEDERILETSEKFHGPRLIIGEIRPGRKPARGGEHALPRPVGSGAFSYSADAVRRRAAAHAYPVSTRSSHGCLSSAKRCGWGTARTRTGAVAPAGGTAVSGPWRWPGPWTRRFRKEQRRVDAPLAVELGPLGKAQVVLYRKTPTDPFFRGVVLIPAGPGTYRAVALPEEEEAAGNFEQITTAVLGADIGAPDPGAQVSGGRSQGLAQSLPPGSPPASSARPAAAPDPPGTVPGTPGSRTEGGQRALVVLFYAHQFGQTGSDAFGRVYLYENGRFRIDEVRSRLLDGVRTAAVVRMRLAPEP